MKVLLTLSAPVHEVVGIATSTGGFMSSPQTVKPSKSSMATVKWLLYICVVSLTQWTKKRGVVTRKRVD